VGIREDPLARVIHDAILIPAAYNDTMFILVGAYIIASLFFFVIALLILGAVFTLFPARNVVQVWPKTDSDASESHPKA
jgi:hypothetical protein